MIVAQSLTEERNEPWRGQPVLSEPARSGSLSALQARRTPRRLITPSPLRPAPAGNPAAVVLDADGFDDDRMRAIAAEFNLSEAVFVFEPRSPADTARLRIFTPARELPFAGHPTVGTAALLAHLRAPELLATQ